MTPEETLRAAADYIEEHGWCQEDVRTPDGRVCLMAAIWLTNAWDTRPERELLSERIGTDDFFEWNDAPGRTVEEVLAVLRGETA